MQPNIVNLSITNKNKSITSSKPAEDNPLLKLALASSKKSKHFKLNEPLITPSVGSLASKLVLHIVVPSVADGKEKLQKCYHVIFKEISHYNKDRQHKVKIYKVAIPFFSTDLHGFNKKDASQIAVKEAREFLKSNPACQVRFVCYGDSEFPKSASHQDSHKVDIENYNFYHMDIACSKTEEKERLQVVFGQIEAEYSDIIINPVGENFSLTPISEGIFNKAAAPFFDFGDLPTDILNLVLSKLPLKDQLKFPFLNKKLQQKSHNLTLWKIVAEQVGINLPPNPTVDSVIELVHNKVQPTPFGRYFSITESKGKKPTIHVPLSIFMLPKPIAGRIMQEIPGKAVLIQVSGLGVSRYFLKQPDGSMEVGVLDENNPNPKLKDAVEVEVVRDLRNPGPERIAIWKKCFNAPYCIVSDWGIPFFKYDPMKYNDNLRKQCKPYLNDFPEPAFMLIGYPPTGYCISKKGKDQVTEIPLTEAYKNELKEIFSNDVQVFLVPTGDEFIFPNVDKRDLYDRKSYPF